MSSVQREITSSILIELARRVKAGTLSPANIEFDDTGISIRWGIETLSLSELEAKVGLIAIRDKARSSLVSDIADIVKDADDKDPEALVKRVEALAAKTIVLTHSGVPVTLKPFD